MSAREYELVLMLDPESPDERRDAIAADARKRIEGKGSLKAEKTWGMRKLAYEIRQRTEADYRFFRFETEPALLEELDHNLKITDGVLRFRIFKVDPSAPVIEPPAAFTLGGSAPQGRGAGAPRRADGPPAAPAEQAPAAEAPAPAQEAASAPQTAEQPAGEAPATEEPTPAEAPAEGADASGDEPSGDEVPPAE